MADEDIKKLPPEERIKKLKELEEKRKKEIEEAHQIIRESEDEIKERRKWTDKVPIPQVASEDFKNLSGEEKEIFKTHRGIKEKKSFEEEIEETAKKSKKESDLEEIARDQARKVPEELFQSQYLTQLSQQPAKNLYQELMQISERVEDKGYINREEERRIEYLSTAMEKKMEDIEEGKYSFTSSVARMASTTKNVAERLKDLYRG